MPKRTFAIAALLRNWYWALALGLALLVWGVLALAMRPVTDENGKYTSNAYGLVTSIEEFGLDVLFQMRDVLHPDMRERGLKEPITIIAVDEATIRASNVRLQNWPRSYYARLIERANQGGASVIGVDVYFSERGGLTQEYKDWDQQLVDAISNAGNVVIVKKLPEGGSDAINPLPEFADAASAVGYSDLPADSDGVRRTAYLFRANEQGEPEWSFANSIAQLYTEQPFEDLKNHKGGLGNRVIPLRNDGTMQIDFRSRT